MNVVIGGSSGIGAAVVDALPGRTIRASRSSEHRCDVRDAASIEALAAGVDELDALVITAGASPGEADATTVFDTALAGTARVLDAFDHLLTDGTVVVCVASIAGHFVQPDAAALARLDRPLDVASHVRLAPDPATAYQLAKHGVIRLVRNRAADLGARGVRIASVSPGFVDTGFAGPSVEQTKEYRPLQAMIPVGRSARSDEIAEVIAFLCSPGAAYVTGVDLIVDGGLTGVLGDLLRPGPSPQRQATRPSPLGRAKREARRTVRHFRGVSGT